MYSLEDVLSWEAEMSDALDNDREKLFMYRFIVRDLKLRRQVCLMEEEDNPAALDQLNEVIDRVQGAIEDMEHSLSQKAGAVEEMYEQWRKLINPKSQTV
jgi:hypothetical protein